MGAGAEGNTGQGCSCLLMKATRGSQLKLEPSAGVFPAGEAAGWESGLTGLQSGQGAARGADFTKYMRELLLVSKFIFLKLYR